MSEYVITPRNNTPEDEPCVGTYPCFEDEGAAHKEFKEYYTKDARVWKGNYIEGWKKHGNKHSRRSANQDRTR